VSIAAELLGRIEELARRADQLERELHELMKAQAPLLLALPGCGPLSAARIVAETGDVRRFRSSAAFAMHTGTAPIPASSGATHRHRLNRGGNRRLNAAVHRIAITQARLHEGARGYLERRKAMGNSRTEAIRALKRHLARHVYGLLVASAAIRSTSSVPSLTTAAA
jgi:transposase